MKTLYHPRANFSIEVPDEAVDAYVKQGWRKSSPKDKETTSKSETTTTRSSASGEDNKKEG